MPVTRAILLAGGSGSRLYPLTRVISKQLLPIHDKPMIYYPLSTLLLAGVERVLVITAPEDATRFEELLGDGARLGIHIEYAVQPAPEGIAQALVIGEAFCGGEAVALILGDNLFYGRLNTIRQAFTGFTGGGLVFGYPVSNPSRYGVIEIDDQQRVLGIEEKPARPRSSYAVPGLYLYDGTAGRRARALEPSARGELEITDLNRTYLADGELEARLLGRGFAWLDTGTHRSLREASNFVAVLERRQGLKLGCIEEAALRAGRVDAEGVGDLLAPLPDGPYRDYVVDVAQEVLGPADP